MGKISHLKAGKRYEGMKFFQNNFASRTKLNLNDLLKRRKEEKKSDKKTNLVIVSGTMAIVVVFLLLLNL